MNNDRWGCQADLENELTGIAERERHEDEDCPPWCGYCLEDREPTYENRITPQKA